MPEPELPRSLAAPRTSWWRGVGAWEWCALVLILASAAYLRFNDLGGFRMGPDEGSYLHSARIEVLERGGGPGRWIADDIAWARELAAKYADEVDTYQHS